MLTDEERNEILDTYMHDDGCSIHDMCKAIERAVLAKAGEQEPVWYRETSTNELEAPESYKSLTEGDYTIPEQYQPLFANPLPAQAIPEPKPVTYFLATRCGFNDGSGTETLQSGTADWKGENNPQEVFAQMMEVHKTKARDEYKNPNWEKVVATSFSIVSF